MTPARRTTTLEERLAAAEAAGGAKERLEAAHALLDEVEDFKRRVSAVRALAALDLVENGNASEGGRLYSQLEISKLLGKSPSLGQQLVGLGRQIRACGTPTRPPRPSRSDRQRRRQEELEAAARRVLIAEGKLQPEEGSP
jgi:hypothetical protein